MSHTRDIKIDIHHLTRVEGHGNILVDVRQGKIKECRWEVPEAARFFEAMVRGRMWHEVHHITSRICGICSIAHSIASVKATESAMGIKVSSQTEKLRKLCLHAENLQSHILHVGYLVLPDLMGVGSVIPLATSHREEVLTVIKLHRLANEMSDILCGRTTHPQRIVPGGFTRLPAGKQLEGIKKSLADSVGALRAVADLVGTVAGNFPPFERETEHIALVHPTEYALYDGGIGSTDGGIRPVSEYREVTNEYIAPHSTAKYTRHKRDSYMVGALARFNLGYDKLTPLARRLADSFGLRPVNCNSFMNNIAQLVESAHSLEDSMRLIDELLADGLKEEHFEIEPAAGRGVSAIEAPRGILFHEYEYDEAGHCVNANCIIPTNQNHGNIQRDMEALLPTLLDKSEKDIELGLEMLVRAYDPCISCSTHFLQVKFEH